MAKKKTEFQTLLMAALWTFVAIGPTAIMLILGKGPDVPQAAWLLLVSVVVATALTKFGRVEELLLGPLRLKLREQISESQTLNDKLRKQALLNAQLLLSLVQRQGRLGGFTEHKKAAYLSEVLGEFDDLTDSERTQILRDWHRLVEFDIVGLILGGGTIPQGATGEQLNRWNELRKIDSNPSPEELRRFLTELGALDEERQALIDDLAYYGANGHHRRADFWLGHGYEDGKQIIVKAPKQSS
jgi:hypothetical protein